MFVFYFCGTPLLEITFYPSQKVLLVKQVKFYYHQFTEAGPKEPAKGNSMLYFRVCLFLYVKINIILYCHYSAQFDLLTAVSHQGGSFLEDTSSWSLLKVQKISLQSLRGTSFSPLVLDLKALPVSTSMLKLGCSAFQWMLIGFLEHFPILRFPIYSVTTSYSSPPRCW